MTRKKDGKSQQRKHDKHKRKKSKIKVMRNQMMSREMIRLMEHVICLAHPERISTNRSQTKGQGKITSRRGAKKD
jgi:hypothetical protein